MAGRGYKVSAETKSRIERALQWCEAQYNRLVDTQSSIRQPIYAFVGKTTEAIDKGDVGTVRRYAGEQGSEVDTGEDYEVCNKWADVDEDRWVMCIPTGNGWYLSTEECDA